MLSPTIRAFRSIVLVAPPTIVLGLALVLLAPVDLFFRTYISKGSQLGPVGLFIKRVWFGWILRVHGIKIKVSGLSVGRIRSMKGIVFASNHQSLLDIPTLFSVISPHSVFLAKKELKWVPFFGWAAWVAGTEFIDRSRGARSSTLHRLDKLLRLGLSVVIFPEGTRSSDGSLLPFKRGAFVLAIKNAAPVVPVTILDSRNCLPRDSFAVKSGTIHIHFGEPIETASISMENRGELTAKVLSSIRIQLEKSS